MGVVMYVWFLGLLALVAGSPLQRDFPEYSAQLVMKINAMDTTWKAGPNFVGESAKSVLDRLRTKKQPRAEQVRVDVPVENTVDFEAGPLPDEFDSRKMWPQCNATIGHIFDQGRCKAGWMIPAVGAMRDRYCIAFAGQMFNFSVQDALSCTTYVDKEYICNGDQSPGESLIVWGFLVEYGFVSGGDWNSTSGCKPYSYRPCDHYVNGTYGPCQNPPTNSSCIKECRPGYPVKYHEDRKKAKSATSVDFWEKAIKLMIFSSGPVSAEMSLYNDFLTYRSGVYHLTDQTNFIGMHGVKIIGWGVENGTNYWLCTNSWNDQWGDKGYVKIRRGTDEVNIEQYVNAGNFK